MNKTLLKSALVKELTENLNSALTAAQATYDIATHEDNKAENKYDTRGLEASYLAGAQAERVRDLKDSLSQIAAMPLKNFSSADKIALTALVHLISNEKNLWLLLLPKGGGHSFIFENKTIKVVTPDSPLGSAVLGKLAEDIFSINNKEYTVVSVY